MKVLIITTLILAATPVMAEDSSYDTLLQLGLERTNDGGRAELVEVSAAEAKLAHRGTDTTPMKRPRQNVAQLSPKPLPSIPVEGPLQNFAQTIDLAKIDEQFPGIKGQLRHCQEQLELTRRYPGRERSFKKGKV